MRVELVDGIWRIAACLAAPIGLKFFDIPISAEKISITLSDQQASYDLSWKIR